MAIGVARRGGAAGAGGRAGAGGAAGRATASAGRAGPPRAASVVCSADLTIASATCGDPLLAETGCREQLLGAVLGAGEDRRRLGAGPLERLLDLGARGVRELGRLVARLLEEARGAGLGLLDLLRGLEIRLREQLARLVLGGVDDLCALALALGAVALDLGLARLQLVLAPRDLLLGLSELRRGGGLRVALDRVGELGGGADQVQRVHADGVAARLDRTGAPGGLQHAELSLELGCVAAEGVERLAHLVGVVAFARAREVLDLWQRGQCWRGRSVPWILCRHSLAPSRAAAGPRPPDTEV